MAGSSSSSPRSTQANFPACPPQNSPEETEYAAIAELVDTYEVTRWPDGREPRGNG
jgi:hypothetical protein